MRNWRFELDEVAVLESGESGPVIGRAEYTIDEPRYLLRYVNARGEMVEQWWPENALVKNT